MSNEAKIYWLTRLDPFSTTLFTLGLLLIILTVGVYFWDLLEMNNGFPNGKKAKKYMIIGSIILFIWLFIPSKNEMILIVAGGKTMDFVQQDTSINKIPNQTTAIISKFLDEQLIEVKKEIK